MGQRRAIIVGSVCFILVCLFCGLGGWQMYKYKHSNRDKRIDQYNKAVDAWTNDYRAMFESAQSSTKRFYLGVSYAEDQSTNLNGTYLLSFEVDTTPDVLDDAEKGKDLKSYTPLKFVVRDINPILHPPGSPGEINLPDRSFNYFFVTPEQASTNATVYSKSDVIVPVEAPVNRTLTAGFTCNPAPEPCDECAARGGRQIGGGCLIPQRLTTVCVKVAEDVDNEWSTVLTGDQVGCYANQDVPYFPAVWADTNTLDGYISPLIVIRHSQDPFIRAHEITEGSLDFGKIDKIPWIYAIIFFCVAGLLVIAGALGIFLALRRGIEIDPFGEYR